MNATYTKLKSGDWGVRIDSESVRDGQTVTVTKKSGETKTETIAKVIWRGNGVSLCALAPKQKGGYVRTCVSGGNCSSIGSGASCGAEDCDGF